MPTRHSYPEGVPCWAATDTEAAATFYSTLFGWELETVETGTTPYLMALQKGLPAAGIGAAPEEQPFSVWTTYFAVDDADAAVDRAKEAGWHRSRGVVRRHGRRTHGHALRPHRGGVRDMAGRHPFRCRHRQRARRANWNELLSDDLPTALPFYEKMLRFTHKTS